MVTLGWVLWWTYTICLGVCALALLVGFIMATVMLIRGEGHWRVGFKLGKMLTLSDLTLLIVTYIFITMVMFGGYL